ncbi:hypothetical protein LINPERPRIM_LOCUS19279, partial [Linum perenne]
IFEPFWFCFSQLKPNAYPFDSEDHNSSEVHTQFWEKNGYNCPQGKVPILRKSMTNLLPKKTHPQGHHRHLPPILAYPQR